VSLRLPAAALIAAIAFAGSLMASAPAAAAEPLATCFWEGPVSMKRPSSRGFDGHFFNYPEESATYWLARFQLPQGAKIRLTGRYAYARYQSLNAYSDRAPTDALSDLATGPDPGSLNPFIAGNRRNLAQRSYTVTVVNEPPPSEGRAANTLYAQPQPGAAIELFYRVYEPDRGRDLDGGTGLPTPELVRADGSTAKDSDACAQVNDPDRSIPTQTIPAATWSAARNSPGCDGSTNPAYSPVRWERFFNIDYSQRAVIQDCTTVGRSQRLSESPPERGGFYSNRDNAYIFTHLSRQFGKVLTIQAKLPTTPQTYAGQGRMGTGQVRFWSLCTGESRVTLRTPDCVSDRELPIDPGRRYTIVVSKAADRPANATERCGVSWVDWGENGDGAGDPDYALLIMRNMLPQTTFSQAIQRVPRPGMEQSTMGEYFPATSYGSREDFQSRGCRASRLSLAGRRLRLDRRGRVRVRVRCTSVEERCTGRLRLRAGGRTVGRAPFAVRSGRSRVIGVRVTRKGRAGLRRARRARVLARGATPVGVRLSASRAYKLRRR